MIKIIFACFVTSLNLPEFLKGVAKEIYVTTKEVIPAIILGCIFWIMYCSLQPHLIQFSDFLFNNISNQEFFYNRSILCLVILIYTCSLVYKEIFDAKHPKRLTGKSIILTAVVGAIYYITVRNDQEILLFSFFNISDFYLLDILLLTVCMSLWSYKSNAKNIHVTHKRIIEDSIHVDFKHDKLFRSKQVKELTNLIKESNPDNAISISITGEWGDGKSTFLSFVENELMNNENIVIKFNPWLGRQNISTTGIFFETLQEELSNYDSRTADKYTNIQIIFY
ncbi:P-loop NTPase fold protein [Dyadobacter sp. 3J3]|uniref:P-loop NTPase fold protein n=1 Tax=Dyadobacter sp. 3J3 TaxID=2606600 RepID=UPI00135BAA0B|nr:P-loop NTPase fold protein [Dyadobacter sp. 3J3]